MLAIREKAINNTFQIVEEFKRRRDFYVSPVKSRPFLKAQSPGKVKVFSEEEIFLYRVKKERRRRDYESIITVSRDRKTAPKS